MQNTNTPSKQHMAVSTCTATNVATLPGIPSSVCSMLCSLLLHVYKLPGLQVPLRKHQSCRPLSQDHLRRLPVQYQHQQQQLLPVLLLLPLPVQVPPLCAAAALAALQMTVLAWVVVGEEADAGAHCTSSNGSDVGESHVCCCVAH